MPVDLPGEIDRVKNRLDTSSAWLWLLEITIPDVTTLRFVNNPEDITYDGDVYTKCNFNLGPQEGGAAGELPHRVLSITNVDLVNYLLPYVEDYDGIVSSTIIITPVNSQHLDVDMSSKAQEYIIKQTSPTEKSINFVLGAANPLIQRFPLDRYLGLHCRFVRRFKGVECGYAGVETVCDGTLSRCKELNNEIRFGGQVGMRSKTVRFV